jgi:hypothetical protein
MNYKAAINLLKLVIERHYEDLSPALYAAIVTVIERSKDEHS